MGIHLRTKPYQTYTQSQLGVGVHYGQVCLTKVLWTRGSSPILDVYAVQQGEDIKNILAEFTHQYAIKKNDCISVMRPGSYQLLLLKAPDVSKTALHAAVRSQVQEQVDFHADDAIVNVFDMPLQDHDTVKMIYAAVADKSLVQNQIDDIVAANFKLQALEVPEIALARISSLCAEDEFGMGMLYFAETHCILNITLQGKLYISHQIDVSLKDLSSPDKFERIKMIKILLRHIQQALSYYKKHFNQSAIKFLAIAPLPRHLPYVQQYLAYYLTGVSVQPLDLNKLFICKHHLSSSQQAQCLPILGAALRGYNA
ncbi:hypothetical protein [Candidatus Albibeggiatoa sp. nov. NOAA]|uniref:hypothetical protein n=1 Tax=Candidatus Albibeggiatoa sp. nov. NOAA TaxID=3162724 RepID=UPI0032FF9399|nr:hypothetical protein [Thiotrichaceae bacterium]